MSVLTYLEQRASEAILSSAEESSINTSIVTLQTRINSHFGSGLSEHFRFGSSTRGTILPRRIDERSDIDYMVVFNDPGYTPQAYLDRLRRFVEAYYPTSLIRQSSPTIILELNHIKFELVPALKDGWYGYKIPNGPLFWQNTNPNDFNATLTAKNNSELYKIKPTIRLSKIWNAQQGYVFDSFLFEKWIVDQSFATAINQKQYLFTVFDKIDVAYDAAQWRKDRVARAKQIVGNVRRLEGDGMPYSAEAEVKKLIAED